jgi:hypothetical protein
VGIVGPCLAWTAAENGLAADVFAVKRRGVCTMRLVRIALLFLVIALVGPGAAGAWAMSSAPGSLSFRSVGAAPAEIGVANIQFSLQRGDNNQPIAPDTRFRFGVRKIWAFWSWDDARQGGRVKYVLRFGDSDVAWGEIPTDGRNGRMEVELERLDGDYLNIGLYRLYLDAYDNNSGDVRQATFEIFDDSVHHDNGNNNNNSNDNDDDDNDNDDDDDDDNGNANDND